MSRSNKSKPSTTSNTANSMGRDSNVKGATNCNKAQHRRNSKRGRTSGDTERQIKEDAKGPGRNDFSWYNHNPELLRAATSLPFAPILGTGVFPSANTAIPGIMSIQWYPSYGSGVRPTALNQASDSVYSFVVHANSRNYNYTAPDLTILTFAGMQVFMMLAAMRRAFGVVKYYAEENRYLPDALLAAMGFDPVDLRQHLGSAWYDINNLIDQSRQLWIPNAFPILERWFELNSNVYTDAQGLKAQIYVFVQAGYYEYAEKWLTTGSAMKMTRAYSGGYADENAGGFFSPGAGTKYPWETWVNTCQHLINNLVESEDRGIIYGDILNAYGKERLYGLDAIPADFMVSPVFNAEMLMQIENITTVENIVLGLQQLEEDIYPIYDLRVSQDSNASTNDVLLNFHFPGQPSPEHIAVATRLTTCGVTVAKAQAAQRATTSTGEYVITNPESKVIKMSIARGSETVGDIRLWQYDLQNHAITNFPVYLARTTNSANTNDLWMMAFDWHPFLYGVSSNFASGHTFVEADLGKPVYTTNFAYGDYDNYAFVSQENIKRIHDAAMFSLLGVPQV